MTQMALMAAPPAHTKLSMPWDARLLSTFSGDQDGMGGGVITCLASATLGAC